jgi:hypothetical protein
MYAYLRAITVVSLSIMVTLGSVAAGAADNTKRDPASPTLDTTGSQVDPAADKVDAVTGDTPATTESQSSVATEAQPSTPKASEGKASGGFGETAKGVGRSMVDGTKVAGATLADAARSTGRAVGDAGKTVGRNVKTAWEVVRDGAIDAADSVKDFFDRLLQF